MIGAKVTFLQESDIRILFINIFLLPLLLSRMPGREYSLKDKGVLPICFMIYLWSRVSTASFIF